MSAAEASEAPRGYPVRTFLDWLEKERIGAGGARERGVHFGALLAFEDAVVNEEKAQQWANRFGRDIEDIWGDGAIREDAREAGTTRTRTSSQPISASPQPAVGIMERLDVSIAKAKARAIKEGRPVSGFPYEDVAPLAPDATVKLESMLVRLPKSLKEQVRQRASDEERTQAQVVRRALRYYLAKERTAP